MTEMVMIKMVWMIVTMVDDDEVEGHDDNI